MTTAGWLQFVVWAALLVITVPLMGNYLARVFGGEDGNGVKKAPGDRFFLPIENAFYRICGIDPESEQRWNMYALSLLAFCIVTVLLTYLGLRLQAHLPFNPDHIRRRSRPHCRSRRRSAS